jgi:predicted ATP-grasp superfamily ATP-dependent carboligase
MSILVTDGENRSALAVTRSLGKKGCRVVVSGSTVKNLSACSKYCSKRYAVPDPMKDGSGFADSVIDIATRERIDVIFPCTDQSIYWLNRIRERLPVGVILACAEPAEMDKVSNKCELFQLADIGVPIPETVIVNGREDFRDKGPRIEKYPVVVKPGYSKIPDGSRLLSASVMYASDFGMLKSYYDDHPALRYPSLIQEVITGPGLGLFTVYDCDKPLALFSHRRVLEKPPAGGVSVISESAPLSAELVDTTQKLLKSVRWKGVAMIEFKRDLRDGKAKLMEINGRFWGSLQLAIASGIDFPAISLEYYLGKKTLSCLREYNIGHRMRWLLGVLDHLIIRLKQKDPQPLAVKLPSCAQIVRELLAFKAKNTSWDVYDSSDQKPFLCEIRAYVDAIFG